MGWVKMIRHAARKRGQDWMAMAFDGPRVLPRPLKRFLSGSTLFCLAGMISLAQAQAPEGWAAQTPIGEGMGPGGWVGAGIWSAAKEGPPAPLIDSLGLGNALVGAGVETEVGWKGGNWDFAARLIGYRGADTDAHASLERWHATHRGDWTLSLEKEPLVWGYGLNGGYVLGEASRPVPKFLVATPSKALSCFSIPLGTWKGTVFLGKIDGPNAVPETSQMWSYKSRILAGGDAPERPYLSGIRAEAQFSDNIEFYLNWITLFGGELHGRRLDQGYSLKDYVVAALGAKDTSVEGGLDLNQSGYVAKLPSVVSASNSDVGMRIRLDGVAEALSAKKVWIYVSRGSKSVNLSWGPVFHQPGVYYGKDLDADWKEARYLHLSNIWNRTYRYTAPSPVVPNDGVGILADWGSWKWGLEYLDTVNRRNQFADRPVEEGHRSFTHGIYQAGFYEDGDPLGSALGGEARYTTLHMEWAPDVTWQILGWLQYGDRPFRDVLSDWLLDHPGASPVRDRFVQVQGVAVYRGADGFTARAGLSVQRHSAVWNVQGAPGTGARGFLEAGWRWGL